MIINWFGQVLSPWILALSLIQALREAIFLFPFPTTKAFTGLLTNFKLAQPNLRWENMEETTLATPEKNESGNDLEKMEA